MVIYLTTPRDSTSVICKNGDDDSVLTAKTTVPTVMRHFERANKNTGDEALGAIQFSAHRVQPRPFTFREKHVACRLGYGSLQRGFREPPERGGGMWVGVVALGQVGVGRD